MGYCVVLGMGFWAGNAVADVKIVNGGPSGYGYAKVACPIGYVLVGCSNPQAAGTSRPLNNNECEFINPDGSTVVSPQVIAFCAKVCN